MTIFTVTKLFRLVQTHDHDFALCYTEYNLRFLEVFRCTLVEHYKYGVCSSWDEVIRTLGRLVGIINMVFIILGMKLSERLDVLWNVDFSRV